MCSKTFERHQSEWQLIQKSKVNKNQPYFEKVVQPSLVKKFHEIMAERVDNKSKQHRIHRRLMDTLNESRKDQGLMTLEELQFMKQLIEEPFDPEQYVDKQFKEFTIDDIKNHQQTILNVFY